MTIALAACIGLALAVAVGQGLGDSSLRGALGILIAWAVIRVASVADGELRGTARDNESPTAARVSGSRFTLLALGGGLAVVVAWRSRAAHVEADALDVSRHALDGVAWAVLAGYAWAASPHLAALPWARRRSITALQSRVALLALVASGALAWLWRAEPRPEGALTVVAASVVCVLMGVGIVDLQASRTRRLRVPDDGTRAS